MPSPSGKRLLEQNKTFGGKKYAPLFVAINESDAEHLANQLRTGGAFARKYKLTNEEREWLSVPPEPMSSVKYIIYGRR